MCTSKTCAASQRCRFSRQSETSAVEQAKNCLSQSEGVSKRELKRERFGEEWTKENEEITPLLSPPLSLTQFETTVFVSARPIFFIGNDFQDDSGRLLDVQLFKWGNRRNTFSKCSVLWIGRLFERLLSLIGVELISAIAAPHRSSLL